MKAFLKGNMVLVAGITLPLLLTAIFFAATQIGKVAVDPPGYSVVFAREYHCYNQNCPYKFVVKNGLVRFRYSPDEEDRHGHGRKKPALYIYDPLTGSSREIEVPDVDDPDARLDVVIRGLAKKKVSSLRESPDGYVFHQDYRGDGNLMTEMFGGGYRSRSRYVLEKKGRRVTVPKATVYGTEFIGWVVGERD